MNTEWRDVDDGVDWGDGGAIELMRKDGSIVTAELLVDELFTGEDDVPIPLLKNYTFSFFDFEKWRYV